MENKDLDELFGGLNFDIEEPHAGHRDRFFKKLHQVSEEPKGTTQRLWNPMFGIAAGFLLALFLVFEFTSPVQAGNTDLASISPEMKQTQEFYTGLIQKELNTLRTEKTPETEAIIQDAMSQMQKLEKEYAKLREDLSESGKDNRVIHAMISNFQQRIDLLTNVLEQIETIKELKNANHESTII
ncbi:hypothetical protein [Christiangramia flava]|uniref:Uncharacterized protein n=1 Tax=Christiangramia flava JLT2011 TaxID=1229726 RepID=A0A1L7I9N4_9FLAO|nr:hypothetical protein [Christiangramia flava]APU70316.1 hypothetical protein GRFL_3592 [Christiangramia flava JLT2011]OSS37560.1 hypothetical protein C723_3531 [Christiangramia flava JLT2011]